MPLFNMQQKTDNPGVSSIRRSYRNIFIGEADPSAWDVTNVTDLRGCWDVTNVTDLRSFCLKKGEAI